ncbi:50S ribosomal protein L6 [Candidatus Acidianus copahuensis]|uniref:Large ribosomal subunit protein uL6 n=1 Tax=Candidatus Acidianus copahuensis TaxID=1160895 RepID=A0A031LM72_9CREN|nr:50S ribosomal protein L6 [Candidatus Acidianus copahuensis]EZQ03847.1 50S ribosomal protein L6 [Candidatus Acidianus copahuensis]
MLTSYILEKVEIPEGITVSVNNNSIKVKGPKGEIERNLPSSKSITVYVSNNYLIIEGSFLNKREKSLVYTIKRHVENLITGVTRGYTYYLKIIYSHFPVSVKVVGNELQITNLIGEKNVRRARIYPGVKVTVKGEDITVEGIDLEKVAQTAANIEHASKIIGFDRRVFGDGIYIFKKEVIG